MGLLQLSLIMSANERSRPVLEGTVKPDGIELICTAAHPSEIFWRQLHFKEFDVSEMSLSSLLMAIANGNRDWVGLPIFTSRRFFHTAAWVRVASGIQAPGDLNGKRVGVPEYQQTGIFPINHGMVVRRSIYEQHPWVALNLFNAFRQAKDSVAARMRELVSTHVELGLLGPDVVSALRVDPYPYGVQSNLHVLETLAAYSHEQGLTPRVVQLDELFAPSTLDL